MSDLETDKGGLRRSELHLTSPYLEPEGEVETFLAEIWKQVLDLDIVGTQDDFFEIGGDSLAATVLASALEDRFDCKFSPSSIIESSTIAAQAACVGLQQEDGAKGKGIDTLPSCLTLFNAEGTKAPLFIVHGRRGFTLYHRSFLEGFESDQPVGFLEAPGLDGKAPPPTRIVEYAEHYLDALRQVAPEGSWQIAANCFGSLIGFEMCLLAEKRGERVSRLMMIDPIDGRKAAKALWRRKQWRSQRYQEIKGRWRGLFRSPSAGTSSDGDEGDAAYDPSVDAFSQRYEKYVARIRDRIEDNDRTIVPSRIAYNPEAMQKVGYQLEVAFRDYILSHEWSGRAFILSSPLRSGGLDVWKHHLPKVSCRVVDYHHKRIFDEGLPLVLDFLRDAMAPGPGEDLQP
jgi:thioesterase domain-containing protein/acyl carrier protein